MDAVVVGAGVVGLACAAALARRGAEVIVLERNARPGEETSSRHSGVIHAGLYYPLCSLKARLCVSGRERLYARCAARGIAHRRTGKLVVARTEAEVTRLEAIAARAGANGAGEVELWDAGTVSERARGVRAVAGLYSPETGIVDAHGLVADLASELRALGGELALRTTVIGIERAPSGLRVDTVSADGERFTLPADVLVNAAGLFADRVSALAGVPIRALNLEHRFCRGDYYVLGAGAPRPAIPLVYPLPTEAGLGVHLPTDLGGQVLAGPDTTWVDAPGDVRVDESKAERFAAAVRRYLPGVAARHLTPGYAGMRPKLTGPGEPARDFVIEEASAHGVPGLIHLLGIESPGLTAALAIAERVADLAGYGQNRSPGP
jgi:L-2-hydroxyglutarate oxidase LhgO